MGLFSTFEHIIVEPNPFYLHPKELLALYEQAASTHLLAEQVRAAAGQRLHLKGLVGSLDTVLAAALYQRTAATQLFILQDKEEAAYFYTDLRNLLGEAAVLLYPASQNAPYATTQTDHADQLMRAEVLHRLAQANSPDTLIVTYPTALPEKVPQKAALTQRTWTLQVGAELMIADCTARLTAQGFERTDFVYEAGQFATRGGIVDIFSYAYQLPFRLELYGREIESIRTFDPTTQRSLEDVQQAAILSNLKEKAIPVAQQSLLDFLPAATPVWIKDYEMVLAALEKTYAQAEEALQAHSKTATAPLLSPAALYETPTSWAQGLQRLTTIAFGTRFEGTPDQVFAYKASAQPSFNQNFALLAENLHENQAQGLENLLAATSPSQVDRLRTILAELDKAVQFQPLSLGLRQGFVDHQLGIACYTDHQLFDRYYRYQSPKRYSKTQALTLRALQTLQPGDYVVHIDHGIGRFAGLSTVEVNGQQQEVLRLVYKDDDLIYTNLQSLHKISKYAGKEGVVPAMSKLGSAAWDQKKKRVKAKVKDIAKELIQLYGKRRAAPGFAFSPDSFLQAELESSFLYEDTPDQAAATAAVKKDMEAPHPMDRLICGDVGFGKTEVAIRAALKAVNDRKQVAVLVPTTILALQHYKSFCARLASFKLNIVYINRFKTAKEIQQTLAATAAGEVNILIGTHRILNKNIHFHDLGLLIIDEEQKFGVKAKERLKELLINVDVLTLTATPIPRTLHFSLMGARDLSVIATPPANRQPIATSIHTFDQEIIKNAIEYELQRGGQVFFVHNRVGDIEEVANIIHRLVPDCRIGVAHGQLEGAQLERRMLQFMQGAYDVLVATSIIESGLDIPNANTILVNGSHLFGLSDLHQMRGRVGRSNKKAFCYLLAPPTSTLTQEARRRLSALEEFSDLGDGFKVAMRDLDIRGAGDLMGAAQSGFIADVGFDTYCQILDDAVKELKEEEFKELFAEELAACAQKPQKLDCTLETDLEALIPEDYVSNVSERIRLYAQLDNLQDEAALQAFQGELKDRFGPLPASVAVLIQLVQLRWLAQQLGLSKLKLKDDTLRCYFTPHAHPQQEAALARVFSYVQQHPQKCRMKEVKQQLLLIIDEVAGIVPAKETLQALL
ncbi:MAG: transcription-repair coupling factor [Roseivirga sp.]